MGKKTFYTKITPLPSNVPRQLALDLLHSHSELIKLNPLVTAVQAVEAPRDARADEYYSSWYEIFEILTLGPGMKKKMSFKGVFHDQPWGLQSHTYAPLNTDMRQKYRIGGNQPGEEPETRELGLDTPLEGLYLREDHEITCAVPLMEGFVKKEMKAATAVMVERLAKKAELLEEGKLHAMFEAGKLKTSKPGAVPMSTTPTSLDAFSPPGTPAPGGGMHSPAVDHKGFGHYHDVARNESVRRSQLIPQQQQLQHDARYRGQAGYQQPGYPGQQLQPPQQKFVSELPGSMYYASGTGVASHPTEFRSELPGDYTQPYPQQQQQQQQNPPAHRSPQLQPSTTASLPGQQVRGPSQSPSLRPLSQPYSPNPSHASGDLARTSSTGSSVYQITNPDVPPQAQIQAQPHRSSAASSSAASLQQWRQAVRNDTPIDGSYYFNSRNSHGSSVEPDHQRLSKLSMQHNAEDMPAPLKQGSV